MELADLKDLYIDTLKDALNAERQLAAALPKLAKGATHQILGDALQKHLAITEKHVEQVAGLLVDLGEAARGKKCKGMEGLIEEGIELLEEDAAPSVTDAGIIAAAQKMEHYEISGYGTLAAMARTLGEKKAAATLERILADEVEADETLTEIASKLVHLDATGDGGAPNGGAAPTKGKTAHR